MGGNALASLALRCPDLNLIGQRMFQSDSITLRLSSPRLPLEAAGRKRSPRTKGWAPPSRRQDTATEFKELPRLEPCSERVLFVPAGGVAKFDC